MFLANTPYLQLQAIRRKLKDEGIPTRPAPFYGYDLVCNLPNGNNGALGTDAIVFDGDSYFVWFSTHHYQSTDPFTRGVYSPEPVDAEPFGDPTDYEVSMTILSTGRRLHTPEFIPIAFCDWYQRFSAAGGDSVVPVALFDGFGAAAVGGYHGLRVMWPEPVIFKPSDSLQFRVRCSNTFNNGIRNGHIFTLCGVKLFTGSA